MSLRTLPSKVKLVVWLSKVMVLLRNFQDSIVWQLIVCVRASVHLPPHPCPIGHTWCTFPRGRFEVQQFELKLSIGSFVAAIGAMIGGIFGMNMKSCLEDSFIGFWGTTALIVGICVLGGWALWRYARNRKLVAP